ncbi:hypothetical protein [Candidatus Enterococcus ferrettii]|uniref:LPXTG cell wall anchor domain-containing protein n=1 Tax=Candidatus Enterococcus ferrettii TaxID=2815324 RepID=A0ABV0ETQ3_9ENTE|nr:hypothetical protein [Enterococcus sp. 665A]MBO1341095.1 hypothetical protein [Enterococcus sp. 665A]
MKTVKILILCLFACFFSVSVSQTYAAETQGAIRLEGWADLEPPQPNQPVGPQGESSLKEQKTEYNRTTQTQNQKSDKSASFYPQTNFTRNHWHWGELLLLLSLLLLEKEKRRKKIET